MDPIKTIRIIIAVGVLAILGISCLVAYHYHELYVEINAKYEVVKSDLIQSRAQVKSLSDVIEKYSTAVAKKEEDIKEAQKKADVLSKGNQRFAQDLLSRLPTPGVVNCPATKGLFDDYFDGLAKMNEGK